MSINNTYFFINGKFNIFPSSSFEISIIFTIISLLPIAWSFSVIASVNKSKESEQDDNWKKHTNIGFQAVKFFLTYSVFIVVILGSILILSALEYA